MNRKGRIKECVRLRRIKHKEFREKSKNEVVDEQFSIALCEQTFVLNKVQLLTISHRYIVTVHHQANIRISKPLATENC